LCDIQLRAVYLDTAILVELNTSQRLQMFMKYFIIFVNFVYGF
jgi:hypothetical protein